MLGTALAQQTPAASTTAAPKKTTTSSTTKAGTTATKKTTTTAPVTLTTDKQKFSYAVGMSVAKTLKRQSAQVDADLVAKGLKDELSGGTMLLKDDEAQAALQKAQNELRAQAETKAAELGKANKTAGDAFLAANKGKEGVVTLPSGLQYKVITQGTGPKPTASDTVVCDYKGTLIDGKEFDSSYKRGQPATFPVSGVIKGWTEALQLMPVGSKWQLFIPSDLAYGAKGAGQDIEPDATLIFEVELKSIQEKSTQEKK